GGGKVSRDRRHIPAVFLGRFPFRIEQSFQAMAITKLIDCQGIIFQFVQNIRIAPCPQPSSSLLRVSSDNLNLANDIRPLPVQEFDLSFLLVKIESGESV